MRLLSIDLIISAEYLVNRERVMDPPPVLFVIWLGMITDPTQNGNKCDDGLMTIQFSHPKLSSALGIADEESTISAWRFAACNSLWQFGFLFLHLLHSTVRLSLNMTTAYNR